MSHSNGCYTDEPPTDAFTFNGLDDRILDHSGIKLFLLTNSYPGFTKILCNYAFGPDWEQLFDMNLFYGRKPRFWTTRDDFHGINRSANVCRRVRTLEECSASHQLREGHRGAV